MPVRGLFDDVLDPLCAESLAWLGAGVTWVDAHTHIGREDPDGMSAEPEELLEALRLGGGHRALVFPMHEPEGYRKANEEVRAAVAASDGVLRWLVRVAPQSPGALEELRRGLDAGALGLKLHPRSDGFALDHPAVSALVAEVAARRGVVLFHAGRGIPELGRDAVALAEAHPELTIVLAHAGISDLSLLAEPAARLPNLLFDTSWWQPADMLQLFCTIPPGRILYASDMPYAPPQFAMTAFLRCAREAGLAADVVRELAGPQIDRVLAGEAPLDLGPPPGAGGLGPRLLGFERATAYLTAAVQLVYREADPTEAVAMARLACQTTSARAPHAVALAVVDSYLVAAQETLAGGGTPMDAVEALMGACLVAGTPRTPAPPTVRP